MKILFCDDDSGIRKATAAYLGWHGFRVEEASSVEELPKRLREGDFGLLICSLTLPFSGGDLALIRDVASAVQIRKSPPKVIFSGSEPPEEENWKLLKKKGFYFINRHSTAEEWLEKIDMIASPSFRGTKAGSLS